MSDEVLDDLRRRLTMTKWPLDAGNEDGCDVGALVTGQLGHKYADELYAMDDLLTHATIYWAGNAIDTSIRTYANNNRYPWTPSHDRRPVVEAPTGITFVGYENPPGVKTSEERVENFLARPRRLVQPITAHDRGGHFIPWEIPGAWVEDLRRTFHGRQ